MLAGCLLALPNIYGSVPAIQIADNNGVAYDEDRLQNSCEACRECWIAGSGVLQDGRVVLRFDAGTDLTPIGDGLKDRYGRVANVAQTLAPKLPDWVRESWPEPYEPGP